MEIGEPREVGDWTRYVVSIRFGKHCGVFIYGKDSARSFCQCERFALVRNCRHMDAVKVHLADLAKEKGE